MLGQQLLFTAEVVAAYLVGANFGGLTNSYMTAEERANLDVNSEEHYNRVMGSKVQVIGWSLYAAILWCLKVCVTALYGRLTYETPTLTVVNSLLTCNRQNWHLSPGDSRTAGICHPLGHVSGRRSHHPLFMPAFPPFLAGEPESWQAVPGDQFAGVCVDGVDPQHPH